MLGESNPNAFTLSLRAMRSTVADKARAALRKAALGYPETREDFPWGSDGYRPPTKEFIDGIEYDGRKIGEGITTKKGLEQPIYYWDPVIAPSGIIFYDGDMYPEWKGNIFIASLLDMKLVRLELQNDKVVGEEWLLRDRHQRVRDVKQAPDGSLYVLTEAGDGALLRISRPRR